MDSARVCWTVSWQEQQRMVMDEAWNTGVDIMDLAKISVVRKESCMAKCDCSMPSWPVKRCKRQGRTQVTNAVTVFAQDTSQKAQVRRKHVHRFCQCRVDRTNGIFERVVLDHNAYFDTMSRNHTQTMTSGFSFGIFARFSIKFKAIKNNASTLDPFSSVVNSACCFFRHQHQGNISLFAHRRAHSFEHAHTHAHEAAHTCLRTGKKNINF